MNIRQMQIFRALCEELNFTKTAARLNMTQPAVSHVVAELERETGTPLFDRIGRRVYLTAAGKLLLEKITRLLELYDDISAGFAGETGLQPLKVGSCLTIANFWLPEIAGKFARACPDTPLEITVDIVSRIAAMLAANKIDIALYEGAVPDARFRAREFSSYRIGWLAAPDHPLAKQKQIPLSEALRHPLLLREKGSAVRSTFDSALLLHGLKAEARWTSVNSQALVRGALGSAGICVIPEIIAANELAAGRLVRLDIAAEPMVNKNFIVYHPDKYLSPQASKLIEIVLTVSPGDQAVK